MSEYARDLYDRLALALADVLQQPDTEILIAYCETASDARRFSMAARAAADPAEARKWARSFTSAANLLARLGAEFGLTPASRARLRGATAPPDALTTWLGDRNPPKVDG